MDLQCLFDTAEKTFSRVKFWELTFFKIFEFFVLNQKCGKFSINFQISGFLFLEISDSIEYLFDIFLTMLIKNRGSVTSGEIVIFRKILFPNLSNFLGALTFRSSHLVANFKAYQIQTVWKNSGPSIFDCYFLLSEAMTSDIKNWNNDFQRCL